ncbi:MAG TPA: tonB-system energizer ExbB [Xanthobacteraceae bacterium]|jgi:biopolymer transport protein ExbB|nr:tonB-system energizer ExbB [Xanthobacteraceae bacterium]
MKASHSKVWLRLIAALLTLCLTTGMAARSHAQQPQAPASAPGQPAPPNATIAPSEEARPIQVARGVPREMSPWSMFLSADILVKAVMVGLAFASLVTWTIFFAKLIELFLARRRLNAALGRIGAARSLAEAQAGIGATRSVLGPFLAGALRELRLADDAFIETSIKERVASRFSEIVKEEARDVRRGMSVLATIGATAPFVGLFGTVWGIMNSFIGISKSQTTNLAVVAPGIAEALLATGIGLAAAIPAVIIYNHFNRETRRHLDLVARASGAVGRLLSHDLDRVRIGVRSRAAE